MDIFSLFVLAISLSLDTLSVGTAKGLHFHQHRLRNGLKLAITFGLFHLSMPILGWVIGQSLRIFVSQIDHWIAFGLLSFIGIKMVKEALSSKKQVHRKHIQKQTLLLLGIATSVDTLAIGITLAFVEISIFLAGVIMGSVAFCLTMIGFMTGNKIGKMFSEKAELVGGIILIGLGIKILIEHLNGG